MTPPRVRKTRRWLPWVGGGLLALPLLLALVLVAALGTPFGRTRVLALVLEQVNAAIPGTLEVATLERVSPYGVTLSQIRLSDPAGARVLELTTLRLVLVPTELLRGKLVASSLDIGDGQLDLRELGVAGRGLLGALIDPNAVVPPPSDAPPPYVRVEALHLTGLSITAPDVAPWGSLRMTQLEVSARFELDGDPKLSLSALSCRISSGDQQLVRLGPVTGRWGEPGAASELTLQADLGGARLFVEARGTLPPAPGFEQRPLALTLRLDELRAKDLALLLADPSLAERFVGPAGLELSASGSVDDLSAQASLRTLAGTAELRVHALERRRIELELHGDGLVLGEVEPSLPRAPLSFRLQTSLDLAAQNHVPAEVRLRSAKLGSFELPELDAFAIWNGRGLQQLRAEARQGQSTLRTQGEIELGGAFDLATQLDLREAELRSLARASGSPERPGGSVKADLRVGRTDSAVLHVVGQLGLRKLSVAGIGLRRADVDVNLGGPVTELSGEVSARVDELALGANTLSRGELLLRGGPRDYRVRAKAELDRLRTALDLRVSRGAHDVSVSGRAEGSLDATPFALSIAPTRVGFAGSVETKGLTLIAGGQSVSVSGAFGTAGAELVARAPNLDFEQLSALLGLTPALRGRGQLSARVRGTPESPSVWLAFNAVGLRRGERSPVDAAVEARLDAATGKAELSANVHAAGTPLPGWLDAKLELSSEFQGGPGWAQRLALARHQLRVDIDRLTLAELAPWLGQPLPVSGEVALHATLQGPLSDPVLHGRVNAKLLLALLGQPLAITHELDYEAGTFQVRLGVDDALGRWLSMDAQLALEAAAARDLLALAEQARQLPDSTHWQLHLDVAKRSLDALQRGAPANLDVAGSLDLSHDPGAEPVARARVHLTQNAASVALEACPDTGVELALDARLGLGELSASVVGTHAGSELLRSTSSASLRLVPALRGGPVSLGPISSHFYSRDLDLSRLPFSCQKLRGKLNAQVDLLDPLGAEPRLAASIHATHLSLGADPSLDLTLTSRADRDDLDVQIGIVAPGGRSSLAANLPIDWSRGGLTLIPDARISVRARLDDLPLAPLLDPAGAVSHAAGRLSGDVRVEGTLASPQPSGYLELEDAELTATALAQPLHGVRGRFELQGRRLRIERFEARDRDGVLRLDGRVDLRGPMDLDTQLNVFVKNFPLRQQGQVVATTTAHAKIDAKLSSARTEVSIVLVDADTWLEKAQARAGIKLEAHPDFVIAGAPSDARGEAETESAASEQDVSAPPSARSSSISLDASDHFWVKRDDFAIQLSTRLVAEIESDRTSVKGRVEIHRGYLDLMGRVFEINRGSHLEFTGSSTPDPVVAIAASHERRSSGKTVKVEISGRGSRPVLTFFIDDAEVSAGEALEELIGRQTSGGEESAKSDATSFVSGLTAGLLATSARRELGAAAPIIMIEPGDQTGAGRIRAGFELDALVPSALRNLITGVYVEGIVARESSTGQQNSGQENSTQAGVMLELYFPYQLFSTGQWGPGTTWSIDWGWQL